MGSRASLNHIYRTVWNHALGAMVAVAEITSGRGKSGSSGAASAGQAHLLQSCVARIGLSALAIACAWGGVASTAQANPNGGVAIHGQATPTTNGNQLLVTTQNGAGTNHSAINWQSFSIPTGSSTYFQQPGVTSTVINRVVTNTPSLIFGTLGSNGNVVLVNQSGITVGAGAVVDTAGFTASALRMTDADAIAGRLRFGDSSPATGGVSVQGNILARSGDVVLIGSNVSTGNSALVQAPNGSTLLAAGQQIEITGRGLEGISMVVQAPSDSAVNLGTLKGDAVGIFAATLKTAGAIAATAVSSEGGKVYLKAADKAEIGGSVSAKGQNGLGGAVHATADKVVVKTGALVDVSGQNGGGEALIGGGYQGKDARLSNARLTDVERGASIQANAIGQGNGGTIVVWSDDTTTVQANLSAQGGALGGKGGLVETSGKKTLRASGTKVNTMAADGSAGLWLLDPGDINIVHGGYGSGIGVSGSLSTITDYDIRDALDGSNVSITTSEGEEGDGNIVFDSTSGAVNLSTTVAGRSLTFIADKNISFTGTAGTRFKANGAGSLSVTLTAGRNLTTDGASSFVTNGGSVTLEADRDLNNLAAVTTSGGNVTMSSATRTLTTGAINTNGTSGTGLAGGNAGNITLSAEDGIVLTGSLSAIGGNGAAGPARAGGQGGVISITKTGEGSFETGAWTLNVSGGNGGNGANPGDNGGNGGAAGSVLISATDGPLVFGGGNAVAKAGTGGNGAAGGAAGAGNSGGFIFLDGQGVEFAAASRFETAGSSGIPGDDGAVTFLAHGLGVTQGAGAPITGSSNMLFDAAGNVDLKTYGSGNRIGYVGVATGSTGGAFAVQGALGVGANGLVAGGNVQLYGVDTTGSLDLKGNVAASVGGVRLVAAVDVTGVGGVQTNGGDVFIAGYGGSVHLGSGINTYTTNSIARAGDVTMVARDSIEFTDIDATGNYAETLTGRNGGNGGNVSLSATNGTVSFSGAISTYGGDGDIASASTGGNAGSVTIHASGISGLSELGKIETRGGIGGTYNSGYGSPVVGPKGLDADLVITAGHRVDLLKEVRGGALVSVSTTGALNQIACSECPQGISGTSVTLSGSQVSLLGVSSTGGNINIAASDALTLNASINTGSGNLALTSGAGGTGGGGSIDAFALSIASSGDVDLRSGHHHVGTLSANLTGTGNFLKFKNNNALDVATISAVQSQIFIETTNGDLHLTGPLTAGTRGQANAVELVASSFGAMITQDTAARIKTTHLTANAGSVELGDALNEVDKLDILATNGYGAMVFKNSGALQLGTISGTDLDINTSTGNGAVTQGYGSTVSVVSASFNSGTGGITLNKTANVIGNLSVGNAGDLVYRGNGAQSQLNLDGITAGSVDVLTGGDIYFQGDMTASAGPVAVETSNGVIDMVSGGAVALGASGNITLKATKGLRIGNLTSGAAGDAVVMVSHTSSEPDFGFDAGYGSIVLTGGGRWLAYVGPGSVSNDFGNLRVSANFKQYDAVFGVTPVLGTGNGVLHVRSNSAYGTGLAGTPTKVYDGTTAISHDAITVIAPFDQNDEDILSSAVLAGGEFSLDTPSIGTNKLVTASRLVFSNVQANEGSNLTVYYGPNASFGSSIGTVTSASVPPVAPPSTFSGDPNSFVNNFLSQFNTALNSQNFDANDPLGLRQRDNEGMVVEGEICAR